MSERRMVIIMVIIHLNRRGVTDLPGLTADAMSLPNCEHFDLLVKTLSVRSISER